MKLYYSPGACSLASDIALHEGKLPATFIKVDLKAKKTASGEDFMAINPKGYVPALQLDDGTVLTENIAILQYLASVAPKLLPQEGMAKWHAIEMLAFVSTEVHKAFKPLFDPSASEEQKNKAKDVIAKRLGFIEKSLGDRDFVVGTELSVVDAYLFVMLLWAKKNGIALPPSLTRYAETMKNRPSVQAALTMEGLTGIA